MRCVGVILAGGAGRRMGGADKALLALRGRPLAAWAAERLGPQVAGLAISANGDPARLAALGAPVLADPPGLAGAGPLAGVLAGLDWAAAQGAEALASVPCDAPFAPADLVARLAAGLAEAPAALAETAQGVHPVFGLWRVALRAPLRAALAAGERRAGAVAEALGAVRVRFDDAAAFANLNAPEDLAAAEARA